MGEKNSTSNIQHSKLAPKGPLRMCTGCREMKPKAELVRVVKSPEGEISLDLIGKAPGRGAYVCRRVDCLKRSRKNRALERVFKGPVSEALETQLATQMEAESAK